MKGSYNYTTTHLSGSELPQGACLAHSSWPVTLDGREGTRTKPKKKEVPWRHWVWNKVGKAGVRGQTQQGLSPDSNHASWYHLRQVTSPLQILAGNTAEALLCRVIFKLNKKAAWMISLIIKFGIKWGRRHRLSSFFFSIHKSCRDAYFMNTKRGGWVKLQSPWWDNWAYWLGDGEITKHHDSKRERGTPVSYEPLQPKEWAATLC